MDGATATLVIDGLFAIGASGTAVAVVNGLLSRQKTKAEEQRTLAETGKTNAEIIGVGSTAEATQVETAMVMVREMRTNQDRLEAKLERSEAKVERLEAWKLSHERRMDVRLLWEEKMRSILKEHDILVDPPPDMREPPFNETGDGRG